MIHTPRLSSGWTIWLNVSRPRRAPHTETAERRPLSLLIVSVSMEKNRMFMWMKINAMRDIVTWFVRFKTGILIARLLDIDIQSLKCRRITKICQGFPWFLFGLGIGWFGIKNVVHVRLWKEDQSKVSIQSIGQNITCLTCRVDQEMKGIGMYCKLLCSSLHGLRFGPCLSGTCSKTRWLHWWTSLIAAGTTNHSK